MTEKSRANAASSSNVGTDELCAAALQRFLIAMPDILDKIVEKAKGGSLPHAKFLFDLLPTDANFFDGARPNGPQLSS